MNVVVFKVSCLFRRLEKASAETEGEVAMAAMSTVTNVRKTVHMHAAQHLVKHVEVALSRRLR